MAYYDFDLSSDASGSQPLSRNLSGSFGYYDPHFLGQHLSAEIEATPFSGGDDYIWLHNQHASIYYDREDCIPLVAYANIDLAKQNKEKPARNYVYDPRVSEDEQCGNEFYSNDKFDRSHFVRRSTVAWGPQIESDEAVRQSDYWTNIVPHIDKVHRDEWLAIERTIVNLVRTKAYMQRAIVVTGAYCDYNNMIYDNDVDMVRKRLVPNAYWKAVIFMVKLETGKLPPADDGLSSSESDSAIENFEIQRVHFWVPQDTPVTADSGRDLTANGALVANFVINRKELASRIGFQYDRRWTTRRNPLRRWSSSLSISFSPAPESEPESLELAQTAAEQSSDDPPKKRKTKKKVRRRSSCRR